MLIFENLRIALTAIRVNKMRSFLTMLGMIIGISSVISIVSIGDTMRSYLSEQFSTIGKGLGYIYVTSKDGYFNDNNTFSLDELDEIEEIFKDDLYYHLTTSYSNRTDIFNGTRSSNVYATAVKDSTYLDVTPSVEIIEGRMINSNDQKSKKLNIVIEESTANELFGTSKVVGKKVEVTLNSEKKVMTIVGVYKDLTSAFMRTFNGRISKDVFIPESLVTSNDDKYVMFYFYKNDNTSNEVFKKRFVNYISRAKNIKHDNIEYATLQDEINTVDSVLQMVSLAVVGIATISLVVGGIGIMNIMLVSVTERTREIGIRKALGAKTKDIMMQFLIESSIISAIGGIIGTVLGAGVVIIGGIILNIPVVIKIHIILGTVLFSACVGIFFGMYPAKKAAKKDPIEALRYE